MLFLLVADNQIYRLIWLHFSHLV